MSDKHPLSDQQMDLLFREAAQNTPVPSGAVLDRVLADADAVLDSRLPVPAPSGAGPLAAIFRALGGWPAAAGMITATVAGVWIGYATPDGLGGVADGYLSNDSAYDLGDFIPTFDDYLGEG